MKQFRLYIFMFYAVCLLVFQIRGFLYITVAVIAGVMALFLSILIPGNSYIVVASMAAAAIGVVLKKKLGTGGNR